MWFQRLLIYDPAKRLTAKGALDHPYFADMKTNRDQAAAAAAVADAELEQLAWGENAFQQIVKADDSLDERNHHLDDSLTDD